MALVEQDQTLIGQNRTVNTTNPVCASYLFRLMRMWSRLSKKKTYLLARTLRCFSTAMVLLSHLKKKISMAIEIWRCKQSRIRKLFYIWDHFALSLRCYILLGKYFTEYILVQLKIAVCSINYPIQRIK